MPKTNHRNEDAFSKYDTMSTDALQQLLREDASKNEGDQDLDDLLCIMEVLAQRRQAQQQGKTPEEALEDFRQYYREESDSSETQRGYFMKKKPSAWIKGLVAVAAVLVLVITGFQTAKAFGVDLWAIVTRWTQDVFILRYEFDPPAVSIPFESQPDPATVFESLEEALDAYSMDSSIVPTWIPEGYDQVEITPVLDSGRRIIIATYISGKSTISIFVADYAPDAPLYIEQSGGVCEIYKRNGVDYYLLQNNAEHYAAWLTSSYECFMGGPLSVDELKQMIDSIQKG